MSFRLYPPLVLALGPLVAALLPLLWPIARNLEYEYATLAAYLMLIIVPTSALFCRIDRPFKRRDLGLALFVATVVAPLPAWLGLQSGLCRCAPREFWLWWGLQVGPHFCWALTVFTAVYQLRRRQISRRFCLYGMLLTLIALLLHLLALMWLQPQKRITHLLAGVIHGAIYDNWIPIDSGMVLARLTHALFAISLLACLLPTRRLWRFSGGAALLVLALLTSQRAQTYPSQSQGLAALVQLMPERLEGERFTIHYRTFPAQQQQTRLQEVFASTQFHMQDLSRQLMVYDTHVHIFIYPSREEKKLWFGGDGTDITDVVTPSIHINLETWPHSTLRHELVHALASSFAFHGLGFHPNLAFTEGLAVALAPYEEEIALHEGAASLLASGRIKRPENLFSPLFWSESGRRAYTVAGSILKFMIDRYGITKVKELYAGGSWPQVFGEEPTTTLRQWREFLHDAYPPSAETISAEALFRYPGIFDDVCPHSKALLHKNAEDPWVRRRQPQDWSVARDYWPWRRSLSPSSEPDVVLEAQQAAIEELWQQYDAGVAAQLLHRNESERRDPPHSLEDVELFLLKIDLLVVLGRLPQAREAIASYRELLTSFQIGDSLQRQLWVRSLLLDQNEAMARPWLLLLAGRDTAIPRWTPGPKPWVVRYLYLRNAVFSQHLERLNELAQDFSLPEGLPPTFSVEWHKSMGMQWMRGEKWQTAEAAFLRAAALAPEAKREALTLYALEAHWRGKLKSRIMR